MNQRATSFIPTGKFKSDSGEDFEICFMELYQRFSSPIDVIVLKESSQRGKDISASLIYAQALVARILGHSTVYKHNK